MIRGHHFKDLSGMRFGSLTAVKIVGQDKWTHYQWHCVCDCGLTRVVETARLKSGTITHCGCRNRTRTHGGAHRSEYRILNGMLQRCSNPKSSAYPHYGGRGIKVCGRWNSMEKFPEFLSDVGSRPSLNHQIERINVNGDYEPNNVRWATRGEQNRNTRRTIHVTINRRTRCLKDWAKIYQVSYNRVLYRVLTGWKPLDALTTPFSKKKPIQARCPCCKTIFRLAGNTA